MLAAAAIAGCMVFPASSPPNQRVDRVPLRPGSDAMVRVKIDDLPRQARIVATALKRYGMIVADNGSDWFISGAPDPRWDNDDLHELGRLEGSDFEVVSEASPPA